MTVKQVTQDELLKLPIYFFLDDNKGYTSSLLTSDDFSADHSNLIGDIVEHNDVNDDNVSGKVCSYNFIVSYNL